LSKTVKKVSTVPKTVHLKKSIDVTDNGTKKIPFCPPMLNKYLLN